MVAGLYEQRKGAFVCGRINHRVSTPEFLALLEAAHAWKRERGERDALRMLRSPYSGVPHEIAGAYATLAERGEPLHELLARERIAVSGNDRKALIAFRQMLSTGDVAAAQTGHPAFHVRARNDGVPFKLATAVEREPGAPLRNRHPHFSASSLNAYVECMRKWYYKYMCAAVEDKASSA